MQIATVHSAVSKRREQTRGSPKYEEKKKRANRQIASKIQRKRDEGQIS